MFPPCCMVAASSCQLPVWQHATASSCPAGTAGMPPAAPPLHAAPWPALHPPVGCWGTAPAVHGSGAPPAGQLLLANYCCCCCYWAGPSCPQRWHLHHLPPRGLYRRPVLLEQPHSARPHSHPPAAAALAQWGGKQASPSRACQGRGRPGAHTRSARKLVQHMCICGACRWDHVGVAAHAVCCLRWGTS
jgi:hypothetical protein